MLNTDQISQVNININQIKLNFMGRFSMIQNKKKSFNINILCQNNLG